MAAKLNSALLKGWRTLGAIRTGVVLLITVVIVSAAGTLILQRPMTDPEEMQRAYSPQILRILDLLGLTNVFHAWWFIFLLLLVSGSIVAASIERFPNAWRYFARPYKSTDQSFRKAISLHKELRIEDEEAGALEQCQDHARETGVPDRPHEPIRHAPTAGSSPYSSPPGANSDGAMRSSSSCAESSNASAFFPVALRTISRCSWVSWMRIGSLPAMMSPREKVRHHDATEAGIRRERRLPQREKRVDSPAPARGGRPWPASHCSC